MLCWVLLALSHFLFFFFLIFIGCRARGILAPQPGVAPSLPASEGWSLNHWTPNEVPLSHFPDEKMASYLKRWSKCTHWQGQNGNPGPLMAEFLHLTIMVNVMKMIQIWEFPGCLVVRAWCFHCWRQGSTPGQRSCKPRDVGKKKKKKKDTNDH